MARLVGAAVSVRQPVPAAQASPASRSRSAGLHWAIVTVFMALIAAVRAASPEERDPYWGARAGIENMAGAPLARPDIWSWSQPGGIWYQNSPAWNNIIGGAWQVAGFWGLFTLTFISITALLAIGWVLAVQLGARPLPGLAGMLVASAAAFPMLSLRATTVIQTLLLAAVWFGWWAGPRLASRSPAMAGLIVGAAGMLLSTAGNWIHLSFVVMAAVVAGMWAIQWFTAANASRSWRWIVTLAGTLGLAGGVLATPYGLVETLRQSSRTREICEGLIGEWAALWQVHPIWLARGAIGLSIVAFAVVHLRRYWPERRASDFFRIIGPITAAATPLAIAGLFMIRFLGVSLLLMLPVFAIAATQAVNAAQRKVRSASRGFWASHRAHEYTDSRLWVRVLSLATVPLLVFGGVTTAKGARPDEQDVVDHLPRGCRLYSPDPAVGSGVILTRPDVLVWMDGRADYYGREQLIRNYAIIGEMEPIPAGATCVITNERSTYVPGSDDVMTRQTGWHREAESNGYVLWVPDAG